MRRALGATAVLWLVVLAAPATASAQTSSSQSTDCEVRVAGHRLTPGGHVSVSANRRATIAVAAFDERPRYKVELELAGVRSTVGTGRGRDFGWRRDLNVPSYARYGVGAYKLRVTTRVGGHTCLVVGRLDIKGRAPITTAAGGAAVVAALLGVAGLAASLLRRGGRPLHTRHPFGVDDPLSEFLAVNSIGDYVGFAEVACDVGAQRFVTAKPNADAVREFMMRPDTRVRLTELRSRGLRVRPHPDVVVPRLRWRPRFVVVAPLLGVLAAVGVIAYLQQAARMYPSSFTVLIAAAAGLVGGAIVGNLSRWLGKVGLNRRLAAAEKGLDVETVEPLYPPLDHLDELDTFVWTPTHAVPDDGNGLPAWEEADRTKDSVATLDPGLQVRVVDRQDGLAKIVCSNGWVGWTDAERLDEITSH